MPERNGETRQVDWPDINYSAVAAIENNGYVCDIKIYEIAEVMRGGENDGAIMWVVSAGPGYVDTPTITEADIKFQGFKIGRAHV